jgi:hypothetical protein
MQRSAEMPKFDVTKLNVAIDRLLETTTNPRHRFLLYEPIAVIAILRLLGATR